jgi:four helix bundle protein
MVQDFKQLAVWRKSHELTLAIYRATTEFPFEEIYGLTGQVRRSAAAIPTLIAEGFGRQNSADFARALSEAMGAANEVEYLLLLARDLGWLNDTSYDILARGVAEVQRMLATLHAKVREQIPRN